MATVAISVWGARGPTIVRLEESPAPIHVNMRHGTVFSLSGTATGRLFAAYLNPEVVQRTFEDERRRWKSQPDTVMPGVPPRQSVPSWSEFQRELADVRKHGLGRSGGETLPGINAMAAPVFDHSGAIALAITAIGPAGIFGIQWEGAIACALRECSTQVSKHLGALVNT